MSLNTNQPSDQENVSRLPWWIRQSRSYINSLEDSIPTGSFIDVTELDIDAAETNLAVGEELGSSLFEVIFVSGGPATLTNIYSGTQGQVKIFIFLNDAISFTDGNQNSDEIWLNQLPVGTNFNPEIGDVLVLLNVGGDGTAGSGYWKEIYRSEVVK